MIKKLALSLFNAVKDDLAELLFSVLTERVLPRIEQAREEAKERATEYLSDKPMAQLAVDLLQRFAQDSENIPPELGRVIQQYGAIKRAVAELSPERLELFLVEVATFASRKLEDHSRMSPTIKE